MEILEEIKKLIPNEYIKEIGIEGSEIVIYTNNLEFFVEPYNIIKPVIEQIKKRIDVRMHKDFLKDEEITKKEILEIIPKEANVKNITFEKDRSIVFIEVENPYYAIGKNAEIIKEIKKRTHWKPIIERSPSLESPIVPNVRRFLHIEHEFRKEFLERVGKRIFEIKEKKRDYIRIGFLGGAREVGRSCILVETNKSKVLIDCGIKPGYYDEKGFPILKIENFDLNELDAIIISHAHIDHIGFVPFLYEIGYDGPIYMSEPTLELFALLLTDFLDVMYKNAKNPIYSAKGIKEAIKRAITLEYEEVTDITQDIKLTLYDAGHILGSSIVHLHIGDGLYNIVYALDQKFDKTTLLNPAHTQFERIETLIIESTYGAKEDKMPKRREAEKELVETVNSVMQRNGIVLIPSFSVERAQDILAILKLNNFQYPVFIDGMIWDATSIFTAYPEYMNKKVQKMIKEGNNPFVSENFIRVSTREKRESIIYEKPSVIISTSGMMTGGPVIEYFKKLCEDKNNLLLFVGYQAENTLGRKIQSGVKEIQLEEDGKIKNFKVEMEIKTLYGLSGHSDRRQLLAYVNNLSAKPKRIFVVHGEERKTISLANTYEKLFGIESYAPRNLDFLRLR